MKLSLRHGDRGLLDWGFGIRGTLTCGADRCVNVNVKNKEKTVSPLPPVGKKSKDVSKSFIFVNTI